MVYLICEYFGDRHFVDLVFKVVAVLKDSQLIDIHHSVCFSMHEWLYSIVDLMFSCCLLNVDF